jgi:5'(3')-deoxyribonucleotidase
MSKILSFDTDDTVLHCSNALEAYCENKLGMKSLRRLRDNYYVHKIFDIDEETAYELCRDFWTSEHFFNLKPMSCALEVIPRLASQGWQFVTITACLDDPYVKENRRKNIENAFGIKLLDVHCTHGKHKADYLKLYDPTIWVEDHWQNCQAGAKLGHKSFLINKTYNLHDYEPPLFTRIKDWYDVEKYIQENI